MNNQQKLAALILLLSEPKSALSQKNDLIKLAITLLRCRPAPIPTQKRVDELAAILKNPSNKFDLRLKNLGLECRWVAHAIARAEYYVDLLNELQGEKKDAKNSRDNSKDRFLRQINNVEKTMNCNFSELPPELRISSFYKKDKFGEDIEGNQNIRDYASARMDLNNAKKKIKRVFKSGSKPKEMSIENFCKDMKALYKQNNIPLNQNRYQLIADLSNFFSLSKKPQTVQTIRKRFSRNSMS